MYMGVNSEDGLLKHSLWEKTTTQTIYIYIYTPE